MKKVGLYCRVSTAEQAENYSIPVQRDRLISYCKAKDWSVAEVYIDAGYSGSNVDRPGINKLIKDVSIGRLDIVLVYKLDRLSRSQKDTLYLIEDVFLKHDTDFVSVNESFDTSTPFGRAMIGILSVFAQLERETIKERTTMGRIERAKEGKYHGSKGPPIGYDYTGGELVINEYEALQVKKVYELYLGGMGVDSIARTLRESGYTYKAGGWKNASAVMNVLSNPVYTGKLSYDGKVYDGQHDGFIDTEIFEKVQERRKKRAHNPHKRSEYLLSNLMHCAHCGGRYCVKYNNKYKTYSCYSRTKITKSMIKDPNCKNKHWKPDELDAKVVRALMDMADGWDEAYFKEMPQKPNNNHIIKDKLADIEKQIDKLMDLYQVGSIPVEQIAKRIEKLHTEHKALEAQLEDEAPAEINYSRIGTVFNDLPKIWAGATMREKREILRGLVEKVIIDGEDIKIEWAF